ncbi:MAG TPA: protein kinase, partial [Candidatus Krumholzibacteria bacterium]|nr:protein kinase [Candidatus Krumholzibacteria bacterium]
MPESPQESPDDRVEPVDSSYLDLVGRIADGGDVDWDSALAATPERDEAVRQLRRLESVLAGHREVIQSATSAPADEPTLFMWGPLAVREKLGEGTFGEVYRAWDARVGREVALKLRKAPASARGTRRWLDEARKLARVRHPNVLVVFGADEHDGKAGIWTELLHGRTLEAVLVRNGPLGAREAALIGADLCSALAAVHATGLIHGDIKTTNIMREGTSLGETPSQTPSRVPATVEAGRIVLMDFGTAFDRAEIADDSASRLYATPLTAAPEVLDGRDAEPASDLYALGVVLYRLVTERYPIEARSIEELRHLAKQNQRTPLRAARPDLPAPFVDVIEHALSADPAARFANAAEMERALAASLGAGATAAMPHAPARRGRSRRVWIGAAAAVLAAAAFIAWRVLPSRTKESRDHVSQATSAPLAATMVRTFSGTEEFGNFAMSTAAADLNYDGYVDWITGAPHGHVQHAYVFFGGPSADNEPDIVLTPAGASNQYGRWVCTGDVNGDKLVDLLVSETQGETDRGRVFVYLGAKPFDPTPDLVLTGERNYDHFGVRVVTLDFNHDGFDDTAVSSYFHDET